MIINVDLNPGIEEIIGIDSFQVGGVNRSESYGLALSGTGIRLDNLLKIFGLDSTITGFLGQDNGLYEKMNNNKSRTDFIHTKDIISKQIKIKSKDTSSLIKEGRKRITKEELTSFYNNYYSLLDDNDYIVSFDDIPLGLPANMNKKLLQIANTKKKKSIINISNSSRDLLAYAPYAVVTDREFLEDISHLETKNIVDLVSSCNYIFSQGSKYALINLYEGGVLFARKDISYHLAPLSGEDFLRRDNEALIAAFLIALVREYDLDIFLRLLYSFNYCFNNLDDLSIGNIKSYMKECSIEEIKLY